MVAFNAKPMLQAVATLVTNLTGIQQVYIGVPEAVDSRVSAYVTLGDLTPHPKANQLAYRDPQIVVTFVYRVAGAEQAAELLIADLVDELTLAVYADRTITGTTQSATMDMSGNTQPAYMAIAGSEFRRYLVVITGLQTNTTP